MIVLDQLKDSSAVKLLAASSPPERLGALNRDVRELRDALYGGTSK